MARMTDIRNIVILTGAGISAESGIDTFRDAGGLWEQHRVEDVATPEGFARDPDLVLRFYDMRRGALSGVEPNAAHRALGAHVTRGKCIGLDSFTPDELKALKKVARPSAPAAPPAHLPHVSPGFPRPVARPPARLLTAAPAPCAETSGTPNPAPLTPPP